MREASSSDSDCWRLGGWSREEARGSDGVWVEAPELGVRVPSTAVREGAGRRSLVEDAHGDGVESDGLPEPLLCGCLCVVRDVVKRRSSGG